MKLARVTFVVPVRGPSPSSESRSELRLGQSFGHAVDDLRLVQYSGAAVVQARAGQAVAFYPIAAVLRLEPAEPTGLPERAAPDAPERDLVQLEEAAARAKARRAG